MATMDVLLVAMVIVLVEVTMKYCEVKLRPTI